MEIEKGQLPNGNSYIEFPDGNDELCKIECQGKGLYFYLDDEEYAPFIVQDQIKSLLPYLQAFANNGTLEPTQETTLQGGQAFLDVSEELATMQEAGVAMAANIVDQGKRIEVLRQLLKEWCDLLHNGEVLQNAAQYHVWQECRDELQEKTSQLLKEE